MDARELGTLCTLLLHPALDMPECVAIKSDIDEQLARNIASVVRKCLLRMAETDGWQADPEAARRFIRAVAQASPHGGCPTASCLAFVL